MTRFERQRRRLLAAIAVLSMILVSLCGVVYAKYVKTDTISGKVNITADIGTIVLQEHKAVRQADGTYALTEELVAENSYSLVPGLDIPKDPHVVITKPDVLPVYVFVEVVDELGTNSGISYSIDTTVWTKLDDVEGSRGGIVYYKEITAGGTFYILEGDTVSVSQKLDKDATGLGLTFHAFMKQAVDGKTPAEIYNDTANY